MTSRDEVQWYVTQLGEVLTFQRGFDITRKQQEAGPYPVISSSGANSTHKEFKVRGPGVVIGRKGTLGTVFFSGQNYWPHDTTLWVKDFHGNDAKFAYYFLQTLQLEHFDAGASNPTLNRNHIHLLPVRYPTLRIQHRIASILSAYDDLIENNTRRIAILEELAQRLYREWFVHFRFPGHEHVKMVDSPMGLVPEGWELSSIRDAASYINRGIAPRYDDEATAIVINQRCIRDGKINLDFARRQSKKVPPAKLLQFGDVLINSTGVGTLGRVAQVYQDLPSCTVDSHVSIVRPGENVSIDYFGLSLLNFELHFERQGAGATGQTELGRERIAETAILCPSQPLQEQFSTIVSPVRQSIRLLAAKNEVLACTRDLLLPKLVSGEVDVEHLDIGTEGFDA